MAGQAEGGRMFSVSIHGYMLFIMPTKSGKKRETTKSVSVHT